MVEFIQKKKQMVFHFLLDHAWQKIVELFSIHRWLHSPYVNDGYFHFKILMKLTFLKTLIILRNFCFMLFLTQISRNFCSKGLSLSLFNKFTEVYYYYTIHYQHLPYIFDDENF